MNTTPKQQDGDGSSVAAASGSRSIEQTVLGVAPAPLAEHVSTSATPIAPAVMPRASVAAAPMIPVAETPVVPPSHPRAGYQEPPSADVGSTMPVLLQRPIAARAPEPADAGVQRTALTSDYLREAREAALAKVAGGSGRVEPAPSARAEPISAVWLEPTSAVESEHEAPVHTRRSIPSPGYDDEGLSTTGGAGPHSSRGFEPVPVVRAPLSESMTSGLGPVADVGGSRSSFPPSLPRLQQPGTSRGGAAKWLLLLGGVAAATAGIVWFGAQFLRNQRAGARADAQAAAEAAASPVTGAESALLANRPAPEVPDIPGRATVVSATGTPGSSPDGDAPSGGASSQSQLAATAGRHVLAGNYAEALPLYQQLERNWPMNTSYAAMARLLKKKVGATSDTQTVTPATTNEP
jgi:hypothetical protein